ncbi:CheY-P phosphatase CheC [Pullulanibacillus camelliae]|uniref:CheY-P phosphatase CheC n=1 Tax=Pullulanibacillus camelliae TaxID=1707096 RepID=A0A8J2YJG7_9BACL|nr:chemotaxis protein CheC [Pullulanibacillus camelliae]GGE46343.1 CheY-P phosphatase CheC [Pullulanibacillus camelliae]
MEMSLRQLTAQHLDLIKEVANIGAGHAATSLSQILNQPINMSVPSVDIASFSELLMTEEAESPVAAVYLKVNGGISGHLFIMFALEEVEYLIQPLIQADAFNIDMLLTESLYSSGFAEIGNILAGSYVSALSDFSGVNSFVSPPEVCVDMKNVILTEGLIDLSLYEDDAMIIHTALYNERSQKTIKSAFTFLPDPSFLLVFLKQMEKHND